jgi:hypothetical protein
MCEKADELRRKKEKEKEWIKMPRARLDPLGFLLSRIYYHAIKLTKILDF